MEKINEKGLKSLKYGEKVVRITQGNVRGLRFVAVMPSSENYLIFEDGEYLTYLHISSKDGSFRGDWYKGKYDSDFIGRLKIEYLEDKLERVKRIYLDDFNKH